MNYRYKYRKSHGWAGFLILVVLTLLSVAQSQGWISEGNQAVKDNQPGLYTVSQFVDGDTITVNMNGKSEKIRMIGVDTPETHKPNSPVQCYGPAASAFTKTYLTGKDFRLVSDSLSTNRDRYSRLLRYVVLTDGTNFNKVLIEKGYGFYYPYFPFTKSVEFEAAQTAAKSKVIGVWLNCTPTQNDKGGFTSNNL